MSGNSLSSPSRCTTASAALLAVLLAGCGLQAQATGVYKWTDADGHIHYGDRPKSGVDSKSVSIRPAPHPDPRQRERAWKRAKLLRIMDEERGQKKARKARQEQQRARKQAACEKARKRLYDYQHASYLYTQDKDGKHVIMGDEAHKKALDEAARAVAKYCQ